MKKQKLFILIICFCGWRIWSQDLTCADFKIGIFYIPTTEELTEYTFTTKDSLTTTSSDFTIANDPQINRYIVVRDINSQTEWQNGLDSGEPMHETLEWIDECTYRLNFDGTKMKLDESQEWLNEHNGMLVEIMSVQGKCMEYKASVQVTKTDVISQIGYICKE